MQVSCWHNDTGYQKMLESEQRYPLLEGTAGKVLRDLLGSIDYLNCIDVGCGNAAISELCHDYTGTDLPGIIEYVSKIAHPENVYLSTDLELGRHPAVGNFDLVICSALIDVMDAPEGILDGILRHTSNYLILHRQEMINGPTEVSKCPSYDGWTYHTKLSWERFNQILASNNFEIKEERSLDYPNWLNGGHSFVLQRL